MSDNNEIDITKSVNQVNGQYFIPKERADRLGLKNGDNIIIKLGGWFNKVRGYVAETMPKSDEFHVIRYKSHEELSEDLTEEINYSKRLMGLNEGLNLVKKRNKDLIDRVIDQIRDDINGGDVSALDELLTSVSKETLLNYLPEEEWDIYSNWDINNRPEPEEQ